MPIKTVWDAILKEHDINYHFIDIDESIIAMAKDWLPSYGRPATNAVVGTNVTLPFRDGQFDVVFTSHCIEHSPDLARTFCDVHRVLTQSGVFVFAVPFGFDNSDQHLLCLNAEEWMDAVEMAGFEVINYYMGQTYPMAGWDLLVVARRRTTDINIADLRDMATRRTKMEKVLFLASKQIFSFAGQVMESGERRIVSGKGGQIVVGKSGIHALLFLRQLNSGIVEISDGAKSKHIDLSTRIPFVGAVDVHDLNSTSIATRTVGQARGNGEVAVRYGALCSAG